MGADDYVVKPFSIRELMLRVRALLRRTAEQAPKGAIVTLGELVVDTERHTVTVSGEEVLLTSTEYKLLNDSRPEGRPGTEQGAHPAECLGIQLLRRRPHRGHPPDQAAHKTRPGGRDDQNDPWLRLQNGAAMKGVFAGN